MSTPAQRSMAASIAANSRWAATDADGRKAASQRGHRGLIARFLREVDPDGVLDPTDRARGAESAMKAHMTRLALASSKSRAARKARKAA